MKKIWKFDRTGGEYAGEVTDETEVQIPYTDVAPLEGTRSDGEELTLNDQMFDPLLKQWIVLTNALDHNELNNVTSMYEQLKAENDELKKLNSKLMMNDATLKQDNATIKAKADEVAQVNAKLMLASTQQAKDIEEIKNQLKAGK